eukprot:COSAG01_NODE_1669_length_9561_cov_12.004122_6_plen_37_part_00
MQKNSLLLLAAAVADGRSCQALLLLRPQALWPSCYG